MALKNKDFIEIEYTGKLDDGSVFDTTDEKTAKDAGLQTENAKFGPAVVCLGRGHILKGLEDAVLGKEPGTFKVDLPPEKAFGKKDAKLLKLMPLKIFKKEKIMPYPGLEVNIDNSYGTVRTVSGGRVIVDFNHPLSGRNVSYELKVLKVVADPLTKVKSVLKNELQAEKLKVELAGTKLTIDEKLPEDVLKFLKERILEAVPEVKDVQLKKEETAPKKEAKN